MPAFALNLSSTVTDYGRSSGVVSRMAMVGRSTVCVIGRFALTHLLRPELLRARLL
jgi:hypothetical protein